MGVNWTKEQQQVISLRDRNLLVSAAAGSGKTAVLVERIITMITDVHKPIDIDRLLIVTFTRAAANEMRERIGAAIEKCLQANPDNEHLQRQATLIHHAQINTIDGFCSYVLRNYFHTIDIDPSFRVADEGELQLLKADVIAHILEQEYAKKDEAFLQFIESYATGKSDDGLEDMILTLYNFSMSDPYPKKWLRKCKEDYEITSLDQPKEVGKRTWIHAMWEDLGRVLEEVERIVKHNKKLCDLADGPYMHRDRVEEVEEVVWALRKAQNYDQVYEILANMSFSKLTTKKDTQVSPDLRGIVKNEHDRAKKLLNSLKADYFMYSEEQTLAMLQENGGCIQTLVALTIAFMEAYEQAKREKNIMDFPDLEHLALQVLVKEEDGKFLRTQAALDFAHQFEEIMIDEYQDSNMVQEYILTAISRMEDGQHNMFMVGDVKQSIYRFRLARPELFMGKLKAYTKEESNCQRIDLHKNFRSRAGVLDSSNLIFEQIMGKDLGSVEYDEDAALYYGASYPKPEHPDDLATEVMCIQVDESDLLDEKSQEAYRELEARSIANKIKSIVGIKQVYDAKIGSYRLARYSDCVILLRTITGWADVFGKVLNDQGVPAYATSRTGYFSALEIQTVLNYLHICDNPRQEIPFTAILMSPMVGLSAQELAMIQANDKGKPIYEATRSYVEGELEEKIENIQELQEEDALASKCAGIRAKLVEFYRVYTKIRNQVSYTPIHELIGEILEQTGYRDYASALPGGEQRSANLAMLVEKAVEFEQTSYRGLFNFIRYIEHLQKYNIDYGEVNTISEQADTVRIMSIHKSKGLEFPIVFVSGMGKQITNLDARGSVVCHADYGIATNYINPILRTKMPTIVRSVLTKQMNLENLGEELRILYVALTRAKEKLILTGFITKLKDKVETYAQFMESEESLLPYFTRSKISCYWDWIMPALARHRSFQPVYQLYEQQVPKNKVYDIHPANISIQMVQPEDILLEEMQTQITKSIKKEYFLDWNKDLIYNEEMRASIQEKFGFVYPYESQADIPAKLSVSELKHEYMEEDTAHQLYEEELKPVIPKFLAEEEKGLTGASRGTAYHRVMECLDLKKANDSNQIKEQVETLCTTSKITNEMAACIRYEDILTFMQSTLGQRMKAAQEQGNLYREQQFVLGIPASDKEERWGDEETILIQGIMDAYFIEDEQIVLVDYKTDQISNGNGQELIDKYQVQLEYYAKALEQLTDKPVKEKVIYSFTLQEEIHLN